MVQKDRVKHLSSGFSMGGHSLSTLVKIKYIVKWANTSYYSLCTSCEFNVPTAIFNPCFNCDAPAHGVVSLPHKKDQNKIAKNKNKFIDMKQIQGGNGWGNSWANFSNKKSWDNKTQKQQKNDNKANGYTGSNNGFNLLTAGECDSIKRVVGLIHQIPHASMIHEPPVWKKSTLHLAC